jgi:manganese/zinc/iron transport system permease protein
MDLHQLLIEPWLIGDWMWRGTLAAALSAIPCAVLGVFLYLRRLSLIADALTHVALPGIVAVFLLTGSMEPLPMLLGAAGVGALASYAIESLASRDGVRSDAAVGIVFTAFFAAGVILLSTSVQDAHIDTQCVLFGDVLGISDDSLVLLGLVAPSVCVAAALGWRWLSLVSFDPGLAVNLGVPVALVHYALMGAVSVTTVASFEAIGAILAVAFIVVPASTAHILADRLHSMVALAVAHALASVLGGMYAAVWFDLSASGAIVCVGGALYALAFLFAPRHGVVSARLRRSARRRSSRHSPAT